MVTMGAVVGVTAVAFGMVVTPGPNQALSPSPTEDNP
jgi:hypothetical protein